MTSTEFIQEFNILYNNIDSNAVPGLEPYEISVLLTKAEYEVVKNYLNPAGNKYRQGYDGSSKRQIDFSRLNMVATPTVSEIGAKFDKRATLYSLPTDILSFLDEAISFTKEEEDGSKVKITRQVIPLSYDDYTRIMSKPFGEPLRNQAWRLVGMPTSAGATAEVIPNINDRYLVDEDKWSQTYTIRYARRPKPIILTSLTSIGKTIDGYSGDESDYDLQNPCELDPEIHREIVQRAVELAKASYMSDQTNVQTQMGTRSE